MVSQCEKNFVFQNKIDLASIGRYCLKIKIPDALRNSTRDVIIGIFGLWTCYFSLMSSTLQLIVTSSLTTTPPVSNAAFHFKPNSLLLMTPVSLNP